MDASTARLPQSSIGPAGGAEADRVSPEPVMAPEAVTSSVPVNATASEIAELFVGFSRR
ncbi:MAG: hypothetical protein AAGG01_16910 [Planctomycetota bacterium]